MLIRRLMNFFTTLYANSWGRMLLLTLYYFAIIAGLILIYGKGDFNPPDFIYQGF